MATITVNVDKDTKARLDELVASQDKRSKQEFNDYAFTVGVGRIGALTKHNGGKAKASKKAAKAEGGKKKVAKASAKSGGEKKAAKAEAKPAKTEKKAAKAPKASAAPKEEALVDDLD